MTTLTEKELTEIIQKAFDEEKKRPMYSMSSATFKDLHNSLKGYAEKQNQKLHKQ